MSDFVNRVFGVVLVEGRHCNPNGDPDAGNRPRADLVSGRGLMTPMSIKRKQRDFVAEHKQMPLYHSRGAVLRDQRKAATDKKKLPSYKKGDKVTYEQLRENQK